MIRIDKEGVRWPNWRRGASRSRLQICRRSALNSLVAVIRLRLRTMTRLWSAELPCHSTRLLQCLTQKSAAQRPHKACRSEINRSAVNGTVKIYPPTFHFDVGLVRSPRTIFHLKMGQRPLFYLRRIELRPARHGHVINGNTAIGQNPRKVSITPTVK